MLIKTEVVEHFPTSGGIKKHHHHHHPHRPSKPEIITRVNNLVIPYRRHLREFSGGKFLSVSGILIIVIIVLLLLYIMKNK